MIPHVLSGDTSNIEARAAKTYWTLLFSNRSFIRHHDDLPNILLNYGYAIIRAAIARNLCAIGFIPQLGIHHSNQNNAFNLADDLIEPYRPFVDLLAVKALEKATSDSEFTTEHRREMATILTLEVSLNYERVTISTAIERTVSGLKSALRGKNADLLSFPEF